MIYMQWQSWCQVPCIENLGEESSTNSQRVRCMSVIMQVARSGNSFCISGQQQLGACCCPSSKKETEEWMCLGTPHSHIPSTCTTKAWEEFTRWTVSSHVLQSAVRGKNCYWPLCPGSQHDQSRFLVHCETEENPLSHLSFRREVIILSQDGSTTTNCKVAGWWRKICHSIVCQMEFRETVTVTKRSHELRGDAKCAKRLHDTNAESVV